MTRATQPRKFLLALYPVALVGLVLTSTLFLGAWKDLSGPTINTRYLERIKDGQTKKHEILTLFGDPQEVKRSPEGLVFIYKSFKPEETTSSRSIYKVPEPQSTTPYPLGDEGRQMLTPEKKKAVKVLKSTLTIRFQSDGQTVQSHEYQEF